MIPDHPPSFLEDEISQIPALQLLQNLGWQYLTPAESVSLRAGKRSGVILDGLLIAQLRKLNKIRFKGSEYEFSEANIQSAVQAIKDVVFDGLVRTNEKIYDLLDPGKEPVADHRRRHQELSAELHRLESRRPF